MMPINYPKQDRDTEGAEDTENAELESPMVIFGTIGIEILFKTEGIDCNFEYYKFKVN